MSFQYFQTSGLKGLLIKPRQREGEFRIPSYSSLVWANDEGREHTLGP